GIDGASGRDLDDTRLTVRRTEDELRDGDRKREAPWTRAARVDEENASALLHPRAVRVAGQDRRKPGGGGLERELGEVVDDVEGVRPHLDDVVDRQRAGPRTVVVVAADGPDRRDGPQGVEHGGSADVSTVDDEVRPPKPRQRLRPHEPVRVGYDPDRPGRPRRVGHGYERRTTGLRDGGSTHALDSVLIWNLLSAHDAVARHRRAALLRRPLPVRRR